MVLGVHVDYDQSLGAAYESVKKTELIVPAPGVERFDALVEKCEGAIREIHRPIVVTGTAETARITAVVDGFDRTVGRTLDKETYEELTSTIVSDAPITVHALNFPVHVRHQSLERSVN